jgi:steroid 5-alpha reductase family enzyme
MKKLLAFLVIYPAVALLALRAGAVVAEVTTIGAFFRTAHPVVVVATIAAGLSIASYVLGALTDDYSWVDRLWSTAPVAFSWVYAARAGYSTGVTVAALLVTLWGARLTYNFARRGGYTTMEDYRWSIVRERIGRPVLWQLFNLLFISGYQPLLFVLFTLPVYRLALLGSGVSPVTIVGAVVAFLAALAFETEADQQQWVFQNLKHGAKRPVPSWFGPDRELQEQALEADMERGFLTHGLFRLSRHPNYFGELAVWWVLYGYSSVAAGNWVHWSAIGAVLLTLLFMGSTALTEGISARRYPCYKEYQAQTSAIVPWPPRPGAIWSESEG